MAVVIETNVKDHGGGPDARTNMIQLGVTGQEQPFLSMSFSDKSEKKKG